MSYVYIEYPKCSTCQKAKKFLKSQNIELQERHIVTNTPTTEELKLWISLSGLPIKKFFNTSGNVYKEMQLKDKLDGMSDDDKIALLSNDGMLIKRPLLIGKDRVIVGFKEADYLSL